MRLAVCFPDVEWLDQILGGDKPEAAFIQQKYITSGLEARDHELVYIAPQDLFEVVHQTSQTSKSAAARSWSAGQVFELTRKITWRLQKMSGIPYLNFFSNYSRYDALLRTLPGSDVVYERNSIYGASVAAACRRLRLPYIMFFDADQLLELDYMGQPIKGMLHWRAENILKYNIKTASCILCVSEPAKHHLVEKWGALEKKILVFPNGVDVNTFKPSNAYRGETRRSLGLVDENIVFLFVGNFYKWHDIPVLLQAFALVLEEYPLARLVLVGSGSQLEAMQQLAKEIKVSEAVIFTGLVPHKDIPNLVNASDVAVAPVPQMDRDLWLSPMKLFEYMASGIAIIATRVGQIAEVIEDNCSGILVAPGSAEELADAMKRLVDDPLLRELLSQQARTDAVNKYSWDQHISRLDQVIHAVAGGRPFQGM